MSDDTSGVSRMGGGCLLGWMVCFTTSFLAALSINCFLGLLFFWLCASKPSLELSCFLPSRFLSGHVFSHTSQIPSVREMTNVLWSETKKFIGMWLLDILSFLISFWCMGVNLIYIYVVVFFDPMFLDCFFECVCRGKMARNSVWYSISCPQLQQYYMSEGPAPYKK